MVQTVKKRHALGGPSNMADCFTKSAEEPNFTANTGAARQNMSRGQGLERPCSATSILLTAQRIFRSSLYFQHASMTSSMILCS